MTGAAASRRAVLRLAGAFGAGLLAPAPGWPDERFITVVSTHTTQDSGLLRHLAPLFKAQTGITIRFVIFGSGQALDTARRGDADVVLSHSRVEEERLVADGHARARRPVMYNDFIIVGPASDPAGIRGMGSAAEALARLRSRAATFISRGDRSGTHMAELALWALAGVQPNQPRGAWYREIGQGMGAALNMAAAQNGYILTDRGTWLNFRNRGELAVLVEGDTPLRNQYGVMLVNPARHPHVKAEPGQAFVDWLTGPHGQAAINAYTINGQRLFFANAAMPDA
jgi:tungstate transport system substrate-binding protein